MAAAKLEPKSAAGLGVKAERRVKAEQGPRGPAAKLEPKVKGEPKAGAAALKAELLHQEAKLKVEAPSGRISALVERGLQLRAMAAKVKQERKVSVKKELKRVKKEHGKGKRRKTASGKRGVRRKGSLARRNASREAMNRAVPLSQELGELVGARALSRPEVVKRLWAHFRERGLLNPADKREALFDERLQALFGKPSARIFELHSLMMPHLDYAGLGAEAAAATSEPGLAAEAKREAAKPEAARGAKGEAGLAAKRQLKGETPSHTKRETASFAQAPSAAAAKRERPAEASAPASAKVERMQEGPQQLKREFPPARQGPSPEALAAAVRAIVPRFSKIERTSAIVEFQAPPGELQLEVAAVPLREAAGVVRQACKVEFRETADGALEPCAEAQLQGLEPETAYRVTVEAAPAGAEGAPEKPQSAEATLPQRAFPAKWTPHEAQLWCSSLQVPEFARKVREYRVDGATLLALGEEDLRALGLTAPFLLRRVMVALQELRAG